MTMFYNKASQMDPHVSRLVVPVTDMEDKSRRNNVRLVGLPEGMEGSDVAGFLRINLDSFPERS